MFKLYRFIKRLFEPALENKTATFKSMFEGTWGYLWWNLIPIVSIPILINYINTADYIRIKSFVILITIVYICMWAIHFMIMKWEINGKYAYTFYVTNKYLKQTILKDGTAMEKVGTGKVQSIVKSGIDSWVYLNSNIVFWMTRVILGIITGVYIIINFDIKYVPYFVIILVLSFISYYVFKKFEMKYNNKVNDINNDINKDYVRIIMSRHEIILNVSENKEVNNVSGLVQKQLHEERLGAKFMLLNDLSVSGVCALLPFLGVLLFTRSIELNAINIAFLISFIYFSTRFMETMFNLTWVVGQIFDAYPKIKTFWDFLDNTPEIQGYKDGAKFIHKDGTVELKNVDLSYDDKKILENFNIQIKGKQKIALIGRSGSGKTTVAKLVSGFMRPNSGEVFVDGQDLKSVALNTYYNYIGYLTQEPMVFDGSIRDNLLYAIPEKHIKKFTDAKLFEILNQAECDFITDLNVHIGEKGIRLSGGERQRLAIAKLMLKNPEIVILDEPTSALDSFSEDAITRALDKLFENKTVIIIAHRLQTVKKADVIYVMEKGKIIEQGNSDELIAKDGEYKKMVDLQSF